jgi:dTDP-4-amino-4,6-dideoxygalactose transaminase
MVTTSNPEYAKMIRMLRDWGSARKYEHTYRGYNYRLEGIQGAILRVKLRHLDAWTEARRANAATYNEALGKFDFQTPVFSRPIERSWARHVYHVYCLRVTRRTELQEHLQNAGIQSGIHYPIPIHLQPAHADLGYAPGSFPNAEQAAHEVLALPVHPELTQPQLLEVCAALEAFAVTN